MRGNRKDVEEADGFPRSLGDPTGEAVSYSYRGGVGPCVIQQTYKVPEAEGWIDIHVYRKLGLRLAIWFREIGWRPTMVTVLGGLFGVVAGHLYYYRDLGLNIIGVMLHIVANLLDNADGQLARLTNKAGRLGRITDSVVDHVIFVNMYLHLGLRCLVGNAFWPVALVAVAAGLSHALQGAAADYYRNAYLYFTTGRSRGDFDSSPALRAEFQALTWGGQFWKKLFIGAYLNFTLQQEWLSPKLKRLRDKSDKTFSRQIPDWFKARYASLAAPAFRWWGWLMTNPRLFLLFVLLFVNRPILFFLLELTLFNLLLAYLLWRQEKMSRCLLEAIEQRREIS